MTATVIDGKAFAARVRAQVAAHVARLQRGARDHAGAGRGAGGRGPGDPGLCPQQGHADHRGRNGHLSNIGCDADTGEAELLALIDRLNADPTVHGILVQLPLPGHLNCGSGDQRIDPAKDVDGFHISNVGLLGTGQKAMVPCTPLGCLMMLRDHHGKLPGLNAVVVGRSNIVGKPMAQLLLGDSCTVTIAHRRTKDLAAVCRRADILVAAVGRPEMITGDMVQPGRDGDRRRHQPDRARRQDASWWATCIMPARRRWPGRSRRCRAGSGR